MTSVKLNFSNGAFKRLGKGMPIPIHNDAVDAKLIAISNAIANSGIVGELLPNEIIIIQNILFGLNIAQITPNRVKQIADQRGFAQFADWGAIGNGLKLTKSHKKQGKGYGDIKFTPEQRKEIQSQTADNIIIGNRKRNVYKGYDLGDGDYENLVRNENTPGGAGNNPINNILLSKVNKLAKTNTDEVKFKSIRNREVLDVLMSKLPNLDMISVKVLKMIVDNRNAELDDKQSLEFYQLADAIKADPELSSLFDDPNDLVNRLTETNDLEDITTDIHHKGEETKANTQRVSDNEVKQFMEMMNLDTTNVDEFRRMKEILPDLQRKYNIKQGNKNPNQNITKLKKDTVNGIFPFEQRGEKILQNQQLIEDLQKRLDADEKNKDVMVEDYTKMLTRKEEIEGELEALAEEAEEFKRVNGTVHRLEQDFQRADMDGDTAEKKRIYALLEQREKILKETKRFDKLKKEVDGDIDHIGGVYNDDLLPHIEDLKARLEQATKDLKGSGLTRKGYNPRNKTHWIQKKSETGRKRFCGGTLNLDEIIEKLLQVRDSNQVVKAIQMLDSIADTLSKKQYDEIYLMINA